MVLPLGTAESLVPEEIVRGTGAPTPPPPPKREGGGGSVPFPLAPLGKALSGPRIARAPSRSRPRDEQGAVGPAPAKARTSDDFPAYNLDA